MKLLIVNADDYGYSPAITRGVLEAHDRGIVTSATLMVNGRDAERAVQLAGDRPGLSLGLHVNFTNEAQRLVEFTDPVVCRAELRRQFDRFRELTGRLPSHLDSHQHVHRVRECLPFFQELAAEYGVPLRDHSGVVYKGGFYAQWEYRVSDPAHVSFEALAGILTNEISDGAYEMCVHPGYYDAADQFVYHRERELELATLCDPRLRPLLARLGIRLISFGELAAARAVPGVGR